MEIKKEPVADKEKPIENLVDKQQKITHKIFTDEQSSNVKEIQYFPSVKTLEVIFKGGSKYKYHKVPQEIFDQAIEAQSIGSFFSSKIKRVYECEKIT